MSRAADAPQTPTQTPTPKPTEKERTERQEIQSFIVTVEQHFSLCLTWICCIAALKIKSLKSNVIQKNDSAYMRHV